MAKRRSTKNATADRGFDPTKPMGKPTAAEKRQIENFLRRMQDGAERAVGTWKEALSSNPHPSTEASFVYWNDAVRCIKWLRRINQQRAVING